MSTRCRKLGAAKCLIAAPVLLILGGASEPGCRPDAPPDLVCEDGYHLEEVCETSGEEGPVGCGDVCVADRVCEDGYHLEEVCPGCGGECSETCVPDRVCEEGYHSEEVCEDYTGEVPIGCGLICVPDGVCEEGYHLEETCGNAVCLGSGCLTEPPCETRCVADTACAPGWTEHTVCEGGGETGGGDSGGGEGEGEGETRPPECTTTCIPPCPEGTSPAYWCAAAPRDGEGEGCGWSCLPEGEGEGDAPPEG